MTTPNLNNLRAFDAAARHGTLGAAAKELNVTSGAISQHINQLEASLEAKLFDRHRRGLRLTDAGKQLHAPIAQAMRLVHEGIAELKSVSEHISLAITPSMATRWLLPRVASLAETNPEISLQIVTAPDPDKSDADFSLHLGAAPSATGREVERLVSVPLVAVTGPELVARAPVIARESFFAQYTLIDDASRPWAKWLSRSGTAFQSVQVEQSALALELAEAGQGIALVPAPLAQGAVSAGRLVILKEFPADPDFALYLIRPANTPSSKARRIVESWIRDGI